MHLVLETLQAAVEAGLDLILLSFFVYYCLSHKLISIAFSLPLSIVLYLIVGHESAEFLSIEPLISPVILNMWALHVSDPFVSIDALEILEVIIFEYFR